jgi:secreted Zn-dependent insulinase-like peptidase
MHHIPLEEILNYQAIFEEYDSKLINRVLGQLNPFNVIIVFSSSEELKDPIKEKYLGAKYLIENLPLR